MNSFSDFLTIFEPFFNLSFRFLRLQIFGVELWTIALNFLVVSTVIGFVTKGNVGIGIASHVSAAADRSKAANERERARENSRRYKSYNRK